MIRIMTLIVAGGVVLCLANVARSAEDENKYVGDNAKICGLCHADQVKAWKEWPMAKAWDDLSAEEKTKEECVKCHVTGYGEPGGFVSEKETPKLVNVQCEACHGPAGEHMKVPITDKEAKLDTVIMPTEKTCEGCHKEKDNPYLKEFIFEERLKELESHNNPEE